MKVILDPQGEVLVFPETILKEGFPVDEMDEIRNGKCWNVPVYRDYKQIPGLSALIRLSNEGIFGDGVLRANYDGEILIDSRWLNIDISTKGLDQICLTKGGADYVSTSKSGVRRVEVWATYADQNPFKNIGGLRD